MRITMACIVLGACFASRGLAQQPSPTPERIDLETEMEVHDTVVQFLDLLGGQRFGLLGELMTEGANVITARWARSGFVNGVQTREQWLAGLAAAPPRPFREVLTSVEIDIASGELAMVRADFTIVRDTGVVSRGVDYFTLIRSSSERHWRLASIAFTSIPEHERAPN